MVVLVKFFPVPPFWFTKLSTLLFGAFKLMVRSLSLLCVILKFTLTLVTTAPAGKAGIANMLTAPTVLLSGMEIFTLPDAMVVLVVALKAIIPPTQTAGDAGVITGAAGTAETVTVAVPDWLCVQADALPSLTLTRL